MVEPKKLKVTELREELKSRGLDSKGNKAQLVKRLEKALRQEAGDQEANLSLSESLDTSTLETSTDEHEESMTQTEGTAPAANTSDEKIPEVEAVQQHDAEPICVTETTPTDGIAEAIQQEDNLVHVTDKMVQESKIEEKKEAEVVESECVDFPPQQKVAESIQQQDDEPDKQEVAMEEGHINEEVEKKTPMEEHQVNQSEVITQREPVEETKMDIKEEIEEPKVDVKEDMGEPEVDTKEDKQEEPKIEVKEENDTPMEENEQTKEPEKVITDEEKTEEQAPGEQNEYKVTDSVGDTDMTVEDKEADKESRKRRRSRSGSHDKHYRSRHSRSRSPRRRRSRSREKRRSGSREKRHSPECPRRRDRSRSPRQRVSRFDSPHKKDEENEDWIVATNVQWDRFNCDLHIRISDDGYKCNPITVEGFAFMWAGVRTNYGFTKGKVCFECKIIEHLNVDHLPEEETSRHVVRVGFSTDDTSMQLGEEKFSYGYGGTAKASAECKFRDYGTKFGEGDVIGCFLDFSGEDTIEISYTKNGEDLGKCFQIEKAELGDKALFAHVLTKNSEFDVNFGQKNEPFFPLKEGYTWLNDVPEAERARGTLPPSKKEDCEIIMMCGLPGAGKTAWATKYSQENKARRYHVLGTNNIIDKMKVMGLPRKRNYAGRWDILIDKSTKCLNRLLEIASKKKRNYILDQTNVYPSAQRRKMRPFEGFQRRAVVIVPDNDEFKRRCEKREKEEGKEIPDHAVWEMKANYCLPEEGQNFDKVEFIELGKDEAKELVEKYNKEGEENLPPDYKRFRSDNRGSYGGNRYSGGGDRRDYRDRDGGYRSSGRYDNRDNRDRGGRGGWRGNRGSYMGYSSNDRQRYSDRDSGRDNKYNKDHYGSRRNDYNSHSSDGHRSSYSSNSSYNNSSHSSHHGSGESSWDNNQGGWGNQQQQQHPGSWGNQSNWGNQGWGNQNYNNGWGQQQWSGYQQQGQQTATANTQQQWQGYYNYQYPQQSNWGNYNYNYQQQQPGTDSGSQAKQ